MNIRHRLPTEREVAHVTGAVQVIERLLRARIKDNYVNFKDLELHISLLAEALTALDFDKMTIELVKDKLQILRYNIMQVKPKVEFSN